MVIHFLRCKSRVITQGKTSIKIWEAAEGDLIWELQTQTSAISGYALSNTNKLLVTLREDGFMQVWDARDGTKISSFQHENAVIDFAFSADDQSIIAGSQDQKIYFWNVYDFTITKIFEQKSPITELEIHPSGKYLAAFYDDPNIWDQGEIWIWDIEHEAIKVHKSYSETIVDFCFDGTGNYFAVSNWGGAVEILNIPKGTESSFNSRAPEGRVLFSPDDSLLLVVRVQDIVNIFGHEFYLVGGSGHRELDWHLDLAIQSKPCYLRKRGSMDEEQEFRLRRKAIRMCLKGSAPQAILAIVHRSRTWLSKWQKRFEQQGIADLDSRSRRPHHMPTIYSPRMVQLIVQTRRRLVKQKVGLIGARAIRRALRKARLCAEPPSLSTIKRVLRKRGLIATPDQVARAYFPKPLNAVSGILHALDWTCRYLEDGLKIYAFHTLNLHTRACTQTIATDKSYETVWVHSLHTWKTLGIPQFLQLDNDAAFCGGYKAPRIFGQFVRLCLYLGIELIFLPDPLPIPAGRIHFIRQVKPDGTITVLNESWKVSKRLAGKYVWATLITHCRRLEIWCQRSAQHPWRLLKTRAYDISETVTRLTPDFTRFTAA